MNILGRPYFLYSHLFLKFNVPWMNRYIDLHNVHNTRPGKSTVLIISFRFSEKLCFSQTGKIPAAMANILIWNRTNPHSYNTGNKAILKLSNNCHEGCPPDIFIRGIGTFVDGRKPNRASARRGESPYMGKSERLLPRARETANVWPWPAA